VQYLAHLLEKANYLIIESSLKWHKIREELVLEMFLKLCFQTLESFI